MYSNNELEITVDKKELLKALKANRATHDAEYQKAKIGFRKLLIVELEKKLALAKDGKKVELEFKNRKPTNNLNDYDDVIGMLELATDKEIDLNHVQYKQYVKNEWDWTKQWSTSNIAYMSAA